MLKSISFCLAIFVLVCATAFSQKSASSSHYRVYVTNERSGNLT